MSYLPLPTKAELSGPALELYEDTERRWGYVPNISRAYALAPQIMVAEDVWSKGVMYEGFLPRPLKEAIATTVSVVNQCNYCASSHAHAYTLAGGEADAARACKRLDFSAFPAREQAALRFTQHAARDPKAVTRADIDALHAHFTLGEIVEIAVVIQQFMGYNWFVTLLGLELEAPNAMKDAPLAAPV
jgi:uncharacterized peroxidase-related enzyme